MLGKRGGAFNSGSGVRAELGEASMTVGGGGAAGAMPMIINLTYRATIVRLLSRALATDAAKEEANAPWRNMIC